MEDSQERPDDHCRSAACEPGMNEFSIIRERSADNVPLKVR